MLIPNNRLDIPFELQGLMSSVAMVAFAFLVLVRVPLSFATDIYREPWHWSGELPAAIVPDKPRPTIRERVAFERFRFNKHTTMRDVIAAFGIPDGFATQFSVTRTEGVPISHIRGGLQAGTFRYILRGGGEILITVSDFHTITAVIRYQKQAQDTIYTCQ